MEAIITATGRTSSRRGSSIAQRALHFLAIVVRLAIVSPLGSRAGQAAFLTLALGASALAPAGLLSSAALLTTNSTVNGSFTSGVWGIAFVKNVATATKNQAGNASIALTVPAAGVAAGHTVIVTFLAGSFAGAMTCADSKGNAYSTDFSSAAGTRRIAVASGRTVTALASGDTITCSYPGFSGASEASANEFSGLSASPLDKTASASGGGSGAVTSGLTATTAQASELIIGYFNLANGAQTFSANASYTVAGAVSNSYPMYKIVSATGQYEANGTVTGSGGWKAVCVTYR